MNHSWLVQEWTCDPIMAKKLWKKPARGFWRKFLLSEYSGTGRDLFLLSEVLCMETVSSSRESNRTGQGKEYGFLLTLLNFCNQPTLKLITWEDKISYFLSHVEWGSAAYSWKYTNYKLFYETYPRTNLRKRSL